MDHKDMYFPLTQEGADEQITHVCGINGYP